MPHSYTVHLNSTSCHIFVGVGWLDRCNRVHTKYKFVAFHICYTYKQAFWWARSTRIYTTHTSSISPLHFNNNNNNNDDGNDNNKVEEIFLMAKLRRIMAMVSFQFGVGGIPYLHSYGWCFYKIGGSSNTFSQPKDIRCNCFFFCVLCSSTIYEKHKNKTDKTVWYLQCRIIRKSPFFPASIFVYMYNVIAFSFSQ